MGLTSPALVVALAVAAVVLAVALLWSWQRLAGPGIRIVLLRVAALCALQLTVLSLIFVAVNRSMEFYASWSDLFGTDTASASVVPVGQGAGAQITRVSAALTITTSSAVTVSGRRAARGGRLESVRIHGALSGLSASGYVYLPAGAGRAGSRLPVVLVITNQADAARSADSAARLSATAAAETADGRLRPVILVMLPAGSGQASGGCLNVPGGPQEATFFAQDVRSAIDAAYPAGSSPSRWGLVGDSSGGYCALQLAMSNSQAFSAAVVPPGNYTAPPGGGAPGGSPQFAAQDSLLWQLRHRPMQPISVMFAGPGRMQPFLSLVRPPMRASAATSAGARSPAGELDWIGRALGPDAARRG